MTLIKNPDGTPHLHQYERAKKPNGKKDPLRFRCVHPACTHWEFKVNLEGKEALCGVCGKHRIVLNYRSLKRSHPPCLHCSKAKEAKRFQAMQKGFAELFESSAPMPPEI